MQPTQPQKTMKSLTTQSHSTRGTGILRSGLELRGRLFGHLHFHEQTRISSQGIYPHSEGKATPLDGRFHHKSRKRTKQPPVCFLYRLPNELIQAIGNLLPLSSAACFSATSRKLLFILGTQYLSDLRRATLRSQHETISRSPMERWLHEDPLECHWTPYTSCAGGIERRGPRPPTPNLPPRLAESKTGGGGGGGPRCVRCNTRVCVEDIFVERC